jgi:hypothetical protein
MALHSLHGHPLRRWLRRNALLAFFVYGLALATCAFCLIRPVLMVNDGHMYMEMARSMRHGSLEVDNGLNLVDSAELFLAHTVKRGPHLYAKYPPLYAVLAMFPFEWLAVRGMYLLNAVALVFVVPGVYLLARRTLHPARAAVAAFLFPLVVPVFPYALMELPHLVSGALVVWAVVSWDASLRASRPLRGSWLGGVAGLLAGLAFGVRLQVIVLVAPLVAIGCARSLREPQRKWPAVASFASAFGACVAAVASFNVARFGSANPLSYGPSESAMGGPIDVETAEYFLRPAMLLTAGLPLAVLAVGPRIRRASRVWLLAAAVLSVLLLTPALRSATFRLAASAASLLLNALIAGPGWSKSHYTLGWMNKALLASTPFLVLGLYGAVASCARPGRMVPRALGWMVAATIVFLSLRDPNPLTGHASMGFMSLSPRYLVEITPALYLLACRQLRDVRFRPLHGALLAGAATTLTFFMWASGEDWKGNFKQDVIANGAIGAAAVLLVAFCARRRFEVAAVALPMLASSIIGYGTACAFAEDSRCLLTAAKAYEEWGTRVGHAIPYRAAIVGWQFGKDAILHLRAERPVIIVDPFMDDGLGLADTLDALGQHGIVAFYFGVEVEKVRPRVAGRYRITRISFDPLLWRFDRIAWPQGAGDR